MATPREWLVALVNGCVAGDRCANARADEGTQKTNGRAKTGVTDVERGRERESDRKSNAKTDAGANAGVFTTGRASANADPADVRLGDTFRLSLRFDDDGVFRNGLDASVKAVFIDYDENLLLRR